MVRPLTRRNFLVGAAAGIALTQVQAASALARGGAPQPSIPGPPFTLGVASGDPDASSVVLWTRLAPDPLNGGGMPDADIRVQWEVATDDGFSNVVRSGETVAAAALAHSVHVTVDGLDPDSWYHYRFVAGGYQSPVARTRTTPPADACDTTMRFAFASCQSYPGRYYTAHANLAQEGHDLVCWLGDYIYEGGGNGGERQHIGPEVTTLPLYRNRYALYKSDPDLQASHHACPWTVTWDDHEVDNNYAGDIDQDGGDPGAFLARRAQAYQAWYEHQPVRLPVPNGPDYPIYRGVDWGQLARFHVLDTRQYRADQACYSGQLVDPPCADLADPARRMLGADQESWLSGRLQSSRATWDVLAQQVVFTAMPLAGSFNMDQWDGYPIERDRIRDLLAREAANGVVITGDIHASGTARILDDWADDGSGTQVATELVGTSISSSFNEQFAELAELVIAGIPWVEYVNATDRGYVVCDVDHERMVANYRTVETTSQPTSAVTTDFTYEIPAGAQGEACAVAAPTSTSTTTSSTTSSTPARPTRATPRFTG